VEYGKKKAAHYRRGNTVFAQEADLVYEQPAYDQHKDGEAAGLVHIKLYNIHLFSLRYGAVI
jgi:hypothetical protein